MYFRRGFADVNGMLRVEINDHRPVSVWSKEFDSVGGDEYVAAAGSGELKHKNSSRINRNLWKGVSRRLGSSDVTKLVATGYDQIADSYLNRHLLSDLIAGSTFGTRPSPSR